MNGVNFLLGNATWRGYALGEQESLPVWIAV